MDDDLPQPRSRHDRRRSRSGLEERLDPGYWCPKCKAIAAGKAERITGERLDLPTAKKAPAKKAAPAPRGAAKKAAATAKAAPTKKAVAK